jgi:microcystin-dependent protein
MAESYIGEIRIFASTFAPVGWAFCDGQLLSITQNEALFSLVGTTYGGDGRTTFALPDFRGRIPVGMGTGPGLTTRDLRFSKFGVELATLPKSIPTHTHHFSGSTDEAQAKEPAGKVLAKVATNSLYYEEIDDDESIISMNPNSIQSSGEAQSHTNMMPTLCINFIIALIGLYPSRS